MDIITVVVSALFTIPAVVIGTVYNIASGIEDLANHELPWHHELFPFVALLHWS